MDNAKQNPSLQALLQEYANAVQLYSNTVAVTYTRIFGFLAAHGALLAAYFITRASGFLVSIIGLILAVVTLLAIEHVWQFTQFRIAQAREIEKQVNCELNKVHIKIKLTTFDRDLSLFGKKKPIKKGDVKFPNLPKVDSLPKGPWAVILIRWLPRQADRIIGPLMIGLWVALMVLSRVSCNILG